MPESWVFVAVMSTAGAIAAGVTALSRPRVALAILFLLASVSRATLETPLGTMRPEMPAVAVTAIVLLAGGRLRPLRNAPRSTVAMALAFGTYLAVIAVSSAFVAPGTAQSLRMVAWLGVSMTSGVVAFVLVRPRPLDATQPLAFAGAVMGAIGIAVALLFLVAGPGIHPGLQETDTVLPRVFALGWEANLYASFLGMCAFFALEAARGLRRTAGWVMLALVLIGLPLGVTRAAYIGLALGAVAYVAARVVLERGLKDLPRLGAIAVSLLIVGVVASDVLLPNSLERDGSTASVIAPEDSPAPSPDEVPPATSMPAPTLTLAPYPDTIGFRLERVPIALNDLRESPLIGFGAVSFGQRHPDRYAGAGPDHIAIMAVAVPYEAGIIGAAGLLIGFAILFASLWRSARRSSERDDWPAVGAAAAFIGSLISALVAYQANNALHFAINWIVIGAAAALAATGPRGPGAISDDAHAEARGG